MKYARSTGRPFTAFAIAKLASNVVALALTLGALAVAFAGCSERKLPGVTIGTYRMVGPHTTNTCGLAGGPEPWYFTINISRDGETLYWDWLDGSAPIALPIDANNVATYAADSTGNIAPLADGGAGACTLSRHDALTVNFGAEQVPTTFTATIAYSFTPAAGSDCSSQIAGATNAAGLYTVLPCALSYDLTATLH